MNSQAEFWDARYGGVDDPYFFGTRPNDFVRAMADRVPPGAVLCLGAGEGRNAVWLAEQGFQVTAIDVSENGLRKTEALAEQRGVRVVTVQADLAEYVIEQQSWSGIFSIFCHVPLTVQRDIYPQAARGLRVGGVFVMEAYTPEQLALGTGGPRDAALLYRNAAIYAHLQRGGVDLEELVSQEIERDIHEGERHNGRSAVAQLCVRRHAEQHASRFGLC